METLDPKPNQNALTVVPVASMMLVVELLAELYGKDPDMVERVFATILANRGAFAEKHPQSVELVDVVINDVRRRHA